MNKKLYLPKEAKNDFLQFCTQKIKDYNFKNITKNMINSYFNYCIKKETYTTLTGYTKIAGEVERLSINKIFLKTGVALDDYQDILKYQAKEYNKNNYDFICEALFNDMFCNIEWITRCKNDYETTNNLYKKIFVN